LYCFLSLSPNKDLILIIGKEKVSGKGKKGKERLGERIKRVGEGNSEGPGKEKKLKISEKVGAKGRLGERVKRVGEGGEKRKG